MRKLERSMAAVCVSRHVPVFYAFLGPVIFCLPLHLPVLCVWRGRLAGIPCSSGGIKNREGERQNHVSPQPHSHPDTQSLLAHSMAMKATLALSSILLATLAAAVPRGGANNGNHHAHEESHYLRTMTNGNGYTLLVDDANNDLGGFIAGQTGVDGIYNDREVAPEPGTVTWVDIHNGIKAVVDLEHRNFFTVYDSTDCPIKTISHPLPTKTQGGYATSTPPPHYLMTFVNQKGHTLLVDQAVDNAGILEVGTPGVDGIYTVAPGRIPAKATGTDTWVDSADGIIAVMDNQNPNYYTVYDASWNPIETVGPTAATPTATPTAAPEHHLRTFTNGHKQTLLVDFAVNGVGVFIEGQEGVDGIYQVPAGQYQHHSGIDTWVDDQDGVKVVVDYDHPNLYTAYDISNNPIETISVPTPTATPNYATEPTHHLRTFTNQKGHTLLVDYAVTGVGVLEIGEDGIDGIYYNSEATRYTGIDTWVNDYDGVKAIVDNQHPNFFTVYDLSDNSPIETDSY
ncbi:hypothetical protein GQ54DRAFT_195800 [Martensiomyces pterosporus]|nr:hypothetical protein GQ54DRAFT_195800 [Martensiomyces pterosporus]